MGKLFSVIVPVYNVEKYIKRCIESVLNQSYINFELILVDDGSIDSSYNICKEYEKKDNRIKVIHKENGGLSSARNVGLDNINGEYVCFIDSDDYVDKEYLMKCAYRLDIGYDICSFCARRVDEDGKYLYEMLFEGGIGEYKIDNSSRQDFIISMLLQYRLGWEVCFQAYNSKLITENNFRFDEDVRFAEDMIFSVKIMQKASKIIKIPDVLYNYTYREGSLSVDVDSSKNIDVYTDLFCKIYKELKEDTDIDVAHFSMYFWSIIRYSLPEIFYGNNIFNARAKIVEIASSKNIYSIIIYISGRKKEISRIFGKEKGFQIYNAVKYLKNGNRFMYKVRKKLHNKKII